MKKELLMQALEKARKENNAIMIEMIEAALTDKELFEYIQKHYPRKD